MPSGKGQPSPAPSKRLNVSRTVEAAMPSRRAVSRVEIPAETFKRMIWRTWRIATLSAGIIAPLDCQRRDPKQASGGARRPSRPRAGLSRSGGRHHLVMVGGIIPLRWAQSSRYGGRLRPESAKNLEHHHRIERRTATLRSVRIRKRRVEFRPERLEIHRDPKGLELVTEVAQTLQPIIDIKKTRLVAHRIISHPPTRMESEVLKLGQVFRTVHVDEAGPRTSGTTI